MEQTENKLEQIARLFKDNNLLQEDAMKLKVGGKNVPLILRSGIEKIQSNQDIKVTMDIVYLSEDLKRCVIKAVGQMGDNYIETFGEANERNCKINYAVNLAEKRALSRIVLKLAGFYQLGVYGEDEIQEDSRD